LSRGNIVTLVAVVIAIALILILVVLARVILRSAMPRVLRIVLLAFEAVMGFVVALIAVAFVALGMGYWPFPWGPDGP
jgi:hypothetical protein